MNKSKKILALLLALVMVLSLAACGGKEGGDQKPEDKPAETEENAENAGEAEKEETKEALKVGMVTDVGGINDQSFNQITYEGLKKYNEKTGNEITYVESTHEEDYPKNLDKIIDEEVGLIWGVGFALGPAVENVAKQNPDRHFATVDWTYGDENGEGIAKNLTGVMFKAQEPSYLVGYAAGLTSETGKVGFVGGEKGFIIDQFEYGYRAGVLDAAKDLGKEIEVLVQYADSFADQKIGKGIAQTMFAEGADIVFHAAGGVGIGVIEAAKEADKWAIGVDMDQSHLAPKNVLTSALKKVDIVTEDLSTKLANGEEIGGQNYNYGLKEGGVGIPEENPNMDKEVYDKTMEKAQEIIDEKIVPPYNEDTFKEYTK